MEQTVKMDAFDKLQATELAQDLYDFKEDIKERIEELYSRLPPQMREPARRTWIANILIQLDNDHNYLAGCARSIQNDIEELEELSRED